MLYSLPPLCKSLRLNEMILRCRRLIHSSPSKPFNLPKTPGLGLSKSARLLQLSPKIVDSVISNCPSDSISLGFFFWCARQPEFFHAPHSFDRMIPVVRRLTFRFKSVSGIIKELESIGCLAKAQTFLILLRIYSRGDMFIFAREVFDEMLKWGFVPNTFVRNVILDVLFKEGQSDAAMCFFRETVMPNFLTFNIVMCGVCKRNDWLGVRGLLREMVRRGFGLNIGTFTMGLNCFKKGGRIREMFQLLGFMVVSGLRPSVEIWSILIDELCRAGKVDWAFDLLQKMVESGCSPTVVTYTSLIKGLFEAQMPNEVLGVWEVMLSNDCSPDLVLYNVLIDSLSKAGRYHDAVQLFCSLQRMKIRPDSYTLSSLLPIVGSSGEVSLLPELISGLDSSLDLVAYNSLLNVLCKGGFPYKVVEVYNDMVARGFRPDSYSYAVVLSSLCKLGCINHAVNFYHSIASISPEVDAYVHSAILDGLIKGRKYHAAVKLFRKAVLGNYSLDVVPYNIVIHGLFKAGRVDEACSLFKQMKLLGVLPETCTYNVMLSGLCRTRDVNAVKQLLREMETDGIEKDDISFKTLISFLIRLHGASPVDLPSQLTHHFVDTSSTDSSGSDTAELLGSAELASALVSEEASLVGIPKKLLSLRQECLIILELVYTFGDSRCKESVICGIQLAL